MGLNEKNETAIRRIAEKFTRKLVKAYAKAIKSQHKKALKATIKKEKNQTESVVSVASAGQKN